jgi:two-component system chemotaxis sensor kinase CheA
MTSQNNWIGAFLQEAEDLLVEIEEAALELHASDDPETINRIFRAFHTIKGSSGMCGLTAVADFTHHIETLLDKVRMGAISATPRLADIVLSGSDQLRAVIAASQGEGVLPPGSGEKYIQTLKEFSGETSPHSDAATLAASNEGTTSDPLNSNQFEDVRARRWEIRFRPDPGLFIRGGNPVLLIRDLQKLGVCTVQVHTDNVPLLDQLEPGTCYLWWSVTLITTVDEEEIRDVFMFVEDGAELELHSFPHESEEQVNKSEYPLTGQQDMKMPADSSATAEKTPTSNSVDQAATKSLVKESTVRVPAARLDRLVNLVGELVMNQSRLSQIMTQVGVPELANPVQEIERLVAELRDDVLGIRMLPIGTLFGRFRRLVHDLSQELGKTIVLLTEGEETELDKSIIDQLGDPLIHILRNSIDHGIESAERRKASGKPDQGTITLTALHTGSTVVIRIADDGAGINRVAVRNKAIEKQLIASDANLSDKETLNLLMLPGFSTAQKITNVSGRGVGMDVVKRQIDALRGSVLIASTEGSGTCISLTLPLTLAIIEGLLVQVAESQLIFPMSAVTENVELYKSQRRLNNGRNVITVRGDLIPYIDLRALFEVEGEPPPIEKIVIVEHEEQRAGFVVDRVLGTHQTVLQPLGRSFRNVTVASGSTIMGDGRVALILDIGAIIKLANSTESTC